MPIPAVLIKKRIVAADLIESLKAELKADVQEPGATEVAAGLELTAALTTCTTFDLRLTLYSLVISAPDD